MKSRWILGILFIIFGVNLSFQFAEMDEWPEKGKQRFMQKVKQFRMEHMESCKDDARIEAARLVDSVITAKYILIRIDTFERPTKPSKPERPQFPYKVDTSAPEKLFKNAEKDN